MAHHFITTVLAMSVLSCASAPTTTDAHVSFTGAWHSSKGYEELRRIESEELRYHASRLGIPSETVARFSNWWLLIGEMRNSGGWTYQLVQSPQTLSICLRPPAPGAIVTMAFQAPLILIGTNDTAKPVLRGECPENPNQ